MLTNQKSESHRVASLRGEGRVQTAAPSRPARTALFDSISRDIGKPLALIVGAAASLKNRGGASAACTQDELIDIIENEAERLEGFVPVLLDMAKLECDAIEMRADVVALEDVVAAALGDAAKALQDRRTEVNLSAHLQKLRLDPAMLQRVLVILIENAARQSPPDSTVAIQAACDATAVRLQVLDEGDGIPPAEVGRMFDQFRLPCADDRGRSGAGMHLAVCRGYIEAMGGTISGSNRTDRRGAVFTITFPLVA